MSVSRALQHLISCFACALLCAAQTQQSTPPAATPTFKANSRIVVLDLVVTDKSGRPVTDLKPGDITILEQGKPQSLRSFEMVDSKVRRKSNAPIMEKGVFSNGPEEQVQGAPVNVLLLDALNTNFYDQVNARKQLLRYIDAHRGETLAVFGLTDALMLFQNFTTDGGALHRAVETKGVRQTPLLPSETAINAPPILSQPGGLDAAGANHYFEDFATTQANNKVKITLDALNAVGHWLQGFPGRKKLIWVAGSFPVQLDPMPDSVFTTQNSYLDEVRETATILTDGRVSVYAIDATGVTGHDSVYGAQATGRNGPDGRLLSDQAKAASINQSQAAFANMHATMNRFAESTGGRAFYGDNAIDEKLGLSLTDGETYYAVSYSPANKKWDGGYRRIDVKSNRKDIEVRNRKGYFALDPMRAARLKSSKVKQQLTHAIVSPLMSTEIPFFASARAVEAEASGLEFHAAGFSKKSLEVRFLVNPRDISFQQNASGTQSCSVKFVVAVYRGSELANSVEKTLECDAKPETYAGLNKTGMLFHTDVSIPDTNVRLRLLVRDNKTGRIGTLDIPYPNDVAAITKP
jgi:VWFA-related protein